MRTLTPKYAGVKWHLSSISQVPCDMTLGLGKVPLTVQRVAKINGRVRNERQQKVNETDMPFLKKKLTIENENGEFRFFLLKIAFKLFNIFLRVLMFLNVILNADNRSR